MHVFPSTHLMITHAMKAQTRVIAEDNSLLQGTVSRNKRNQHANPLAIVQVVIPEEFDKCSLLRCVML